MFQFLGLHWLLLHNLLLVGGTQASGTVTPTSALKPSDTSLRTSDQEHGDQATDLLASQVKGRALAHSLFRGHVLKEAEK